MVYCGWLTHSALVIQIWDFLTPIPLSQFLDPLKNVTEPPSAYMRTNHTHKMSNTL